MFVDQVAIDIEAGDGGNGCCSFRRERYVARGGPDGGDGGDGGSIIVVAEEGVDNLSALAHRKLWRAKRGGHGQGARRHGRSGDDLVLKVPPGTILRDASQHFVIKDLDVSGAQLVAAKGGRGGRGNAHFKSSTNRAPRQTTAGEPGEHRRILLELKMIADAGLIGLPNAGKSTLLSRLTRARPKVANYPFTTRHPNLGRVDLDLDHSFIVADIPGLIAGAHHGAGLGHEFLRHVERTRLLIHLVEPMPSDGTEPLENYRTIRHELQQYAIDLSDRPELIVVSKGELPGADSVRDHLAEELGRPVLLISAATGRGLHDLVRQTADMLRRGDDD